MYWVYILKSLKDDGYYTGSTADINDRIKRHREGRSKSTKYRLPLKLVYKKSFSTRSGAVIFEKEIKKQKSKKHIEKIIKNSLGR